MSLSDLAAIVSCVSGVVVVASVAFLALRMRQAIASPTSATRQGGDSGQKTEPPASPLRLVFSFFNSGFFIAILSSIAATVLTQCYAANQSRDSELATRRTELSQLIVELDLRVARLGVISKQSTQPQSFTAAQLLDIGKRAKAIVAGNSATVTSDPAFHDFHMVTLLSRAEMAAGLNLTNKRYLLDFTDYTDNFALNKSTMLYNRLYPLVFYLETHMASGDLPALSSEPARQSYQSAVYTAYDNIYAAKYPP